MEGNEEDKVERLVENPNTDSLLDQIERTVADIGEKEQKIEDIKGKLKFASGVPIIPKRGEYNLDRRGYYDGPIDSKTRSKISGRKISIRGVK